MCIVASAFILNQANEQKMPLSDFPHTHTVFASAIVVNIALVLCRAAQSFGAPVLFPAGYAQGDYRSREKETKIGGTVCTQTDATHTTNFGMNWHCGSQHGPPSQC